MRAAIVARYGPPESIEIGEVPRPEPRAGHVLVRVEAAGVTAGDARLRGASFPPGFGTLARLGMGVRGPRARVLGNSFSGIVEQLGPGVTDLEPGDEVAGMTGSRMGTHAHLALAPVRSIARKPEGITHADAAAALFGGTTALHFLRDRAGLEEGESVLVNGASGSVGSAAVQIAHHLGATVTAVSSAPNHELALRLGASRAIDYTRSPVESLAERFDVVLDAVGNVSRTTGLGLLADGGRLALVVAGLVDTVRARGRVLAGPAPESAALVADVLELVARGHLDPLTEALAGLDSLREAHRRVDSGRKVGNLVVLPHEA